MAEQGRIQALVNTRQERGPGLMLALGLVLVLAVAGVSYLMLRPASPLKMTPGGTASPPEGLVSAERLKTVLADLDARDPGWRFADLEKARAEVSGDDNAAPRVERTARLIPRGWKVSDFRLARARLPLEPRGTGDEPHVELLALQPAFKAGRNLAALSRGRYDAPWDLANPLATPLPHLADATMVAELMALDVEAWIHEDDLPRAAESCRAVLNTGRSIGDEPALESQLVHAGVEALTAEMVERLLASGAAPAAALASLQEGLLQEGSARLLEIAARGDRAGLHGLMLTLETGQLDRADLARSGVAAGPGSRTHGIRVILNDPALSHETALRYAHAWLLEHLTGYVELGAKPYHEMGPRLAELQEAVLKAPPAAKPLIPAMRDAALGFQQRQALLRCAAAGVAVERYRLAKKKWPEKLADLVPEFLAEVPADPFDGQPVRLDRTDRDVVVYTVGPDGQDNGAPFAGLNTLKPGTDVGFRVREPAARGPAKR